MIAHAIRSPSGASGWLECAGWASDSKGSKYADEGTAAHELAATCLSCSTETRDHLGVAVDVGANTFVVDDEMALAVGDYVGYVRDVVKGTGGELLVEQKLSIEAITGEAGAKGTSDAVILAPGELIIADLKYGRGVPVEADNNPQLQIYALAAMDEFSLAHDFSTVRMVIHQPRLGAVSEWVQPVEQLEAFRAHIRERIAIHDANPDARNPGTKQCQWCANKATCSALARKVQDEIGSDFEDLTTFNREMTEHSLSRRGHLDSDELAAAMKAADLIEIWLKAVRAEVETRLLAGQAVPGFKLVQGKKGNRKWTNEAEAEITLKAMRVKHEQMYDYSVISPTSAEKLAKAEVIGPRQWPKLQALITQAEGKPSVAPETDKRPALVMSAVADDFTDVTASPDTCDLA